MPVTSAPGSRRLTSVRSALLGQSKRKKKKNTFIRCLAETLEPPRLGALITGIKSLKINEENTAHPSAAVVSGPLGAIGGRGAAGEN